ncbi:MAG: DUF1638 domain-containing protein [Acidiferrobacterales bacterium]|nr:DUF1638 domain-containing protein [Acidiferrobacterales bacterium]
MNLQNPLQQTRDNHSTSRSELQHGDTPGTHTERVLVIACGALAPDLVRVRDMNGWDHIDFQCLPAELHNQPQLITGKVREKIQQNRNAYKTIFVGYSDCGTGGQLDALIEQEKVERLPGAHCYEMFSGSETFDALHKKELGTFYLTDFLARHFERLIVRGLGIDKHPELKELYFSNYKKLVYLEQCPDEKIESRAQEAAQLLELEYEKIHTGDDYLTQSLNVIVNPEKTA